MEIRQLEYFLAIAKLGEISSAAKVLGVSGPTLSQAVRAFERQLGVQLFHRLDSGLVLSDAGRALMAPARRVLRNASNLSNVLSVGAGSVSGNLEIAISSSLADSVIDLVADFCSRYPGVEVRMSTLESDLLRDSDIVSSGAADGIITYLPTRHGALAVLPLGEEEYVIAFPAKTKLPEGPIRLALADPPDVPLIVHRRGADTSHEVMGAMSLWSERRGVAVVVEHAELLLPLAAAGVGAAVVPRSTAETCDGLLLRAFDPPLVRSFGLLHGLSCQTAVAVAFTAVVREQASAHRSWDESGEVIEQLGPAQGWP